MEAKLSFVDKFIAHASGMDFVGTPVEDPRLVEQRKIQAYLKENPPVTAHERAVRPSRKELRVITFARDLVAAAKHIKDHPGKTALHLLGSVSLLASLSGCFQTAGGELRPTDLPNTLTPIPSATKLDTATPIVVEPPTEVVVVATNAPIPTETPTDAPTNIPFTVTPGVNGTDIVATLGALQGTATAQSENLKATIAALQGKPTVIVPAVVTATSAPTQKIEATPGKIPVSAFHASILSPEMAVLDNKGIARVDIVKYRAYLKEFIRQDGKTPTGEVDFLAQMLGTKIGPNRMTLDHSPNFWMDHEKGGLGWTGDEPIYADLNEALMTPWENRFGAETIDGTRGFAIRTNALNFEKTIQIAAVTRYLLGAKMQGLSQDEIVAFLNENDDEIHGLVKALIASTGYEPKNKIAPEVWPGAAKIFTTNEVANIMDDEGKVCLKVMEKALTRDGQLEGEGETDYTLNFEGTSRLSDELPTHNDSESEILAAFTFDTRAKAFSDGVFSPNKFGTIRVDIARLDNIQDTISHKVLTPDDPGSANTQPIWVKISENVWVPCGEEEGVPPTKKPKIVVTRPRGDVPKETPRIPSTPTLPVPTATPRLTDVATNVPPATWTPLPPKVLPTDVTYATEVPTSPPVIPATEVPKPQDTAVPPVVPTSGFN
jgi:hypothetical protein